MNRNLRTTGMALFCGIALFCLTGTQTASAQMSDAAPPAKTADKPAVSTTTTPAAPVSEEQAKKADDAFEAGRQLFFQGDYEKAITQLTTATKLNPEKTSYKLQLAKAHRYAGKPAAAIAQLEEILKLNPDHVDAGIELCDLLTPEKKPERVIAVLTPLLKFKHDYPMYHLLAEAHYQKEQYDDARKYFEEAVKLNPRGADDHYQLGNIYLAQQRFAKAAESYETAGQNGFDLAVYHFKLASVYFNLHNYLGQVTTAEVLGGEQGQIKNDLYLIEPLPNTKDQFFVAHPRSAIYQAAKAQAMGIKVFEIRFLEANIWLNARRFAKADPIYSELREKVAPADKGLFWFDWAQTSLGLEDYDAYLTRLKEAILAEKDVYQPTLADAYVTVANRYHQRGESAKYIEYLEKAVETTPLSARLHLMLGDAHWLENDHPHAVAQYQLVLELEPDHAQRVHLLNRIVGRDESSASLYTGQ